MLIPASGYATRMNRIPKFLLPGNTLGDALLEIHINNAYDFYDNILIGTRPELLPLLNEKRLGSKVQILSFKTSTMTETVLKLIEQSESEDFGLIMPDTYFLGENPHEFLSTLTEDFRLALWNIRESQRGKLGQVRTRGTSVVEVVDKDPNCDLENSWGALSFNRTFTELFDTEMPHVGYAIPKSFNEDFENAFKVLNGQYYDCGTPGEYFELVLTFRK